MFSPLRSRWLVGSHPLHGLVLPLLLLFLTAPLVIWAAAPGVTPLAVTEVICDNQDTACFSKYESSGVGSWGYVPFGGVGSSGAYNGHAYWTYNSLNSAIDWGMWQPNLPQAGTYDVSVWYPYFPGIAPETNSASYQVHHAGGDQFVSWNQAISAGQWNKIATVTCTVGTACYVKLTDATSEGSNTRRVWFDAVKFTLTSAPPTTYAVTGTVRDSSGTGLAGVTVSDGTRNAVTDNTGSYTLNGVPAGSYTLTPTKNNYSFTPATSNITVAGNLSGQNFTGTLSSIPDTTPPDGSVTAPLHGQTIDATTLTFSAVASDNAGGSGVARVQFNVYYNGAWHNVGSATTSPYYVRWTPPAGLASQQLQFAIHVFDTAGNQRIDPGGIRLVNFKANPSVDNGFKLPYPGGVGYETTQGNNSAFSHNSRYAATYAFDFGMPRGREVVATRNGRVVGVKSNSTRGGCSEAYFSDANVIRVRHLDGSDSLYVHMDSVAVNNGDYVQRGQVIGRSGQTGYSCGAHLHFDRRNAGGSATIPTSFLDVAGGVPQTGGWYRSGNYVGLASVMEHAAIQPTAQVSDTVAPVGNVQFYLTSTTPYTLWLAAEDDTTPLTSLKLRLADTEAGLASAAWQPFASEVTWNQTTVWVQYRDEAGKLSDSYAATLDTVATSPVTAAFSTEASVCANTEMTVTNQTTPFSTQYQWNWDLGNGVTSIASEPASTTYNVGTYTVTLQVSGASNVSTVSRQVTVLPAPDAAFTLTRDRNTVTVTSNDSTATAWTWDFGDGATATGRTATHIYTNIATGEAAPVIHATVQGANGCGGRAAAVVATSTVFLPLLMR